MQLSYRFERDEMAARSPERSPAQDALAAVEECRATTTEGALEVVGTDPAGCWIDVRIDLPADAEPEKLATRWRQSLTRHGLNAIFLGS